MFTKHICKDHHLVFTWCSLFDLVDLSLAIQVAGIVDGGLPLLPCQVAGGSPGVYHLIVRYFYSFHSFGWGLQNSNVYLKVKRAVFYFATLHFYFIWNVKVILNHYFIWNYWFTRYNNQGLHQHLISHISNVSNSSFGGVQVVINVLV